MTTQRPIYFSEVAHLLKKQRKTIGFYAATGWLLTFLGMLIFYEPIYRGEATFRSAREQSEEITNVESILRSIRFVGEESPAHSVMLSKTLLGRVVEELGLQVMETTSYRLRRLLTKKSPSSTIFGPVLYVGESEITFFLKKLEGEQFAIFNGQKQEVGIGKVGIPFQIGEAQLTVRSLHLGNSPTHFKVVPKRVATSQLIQQVKIKNHRQDPHLLHLRCDHPQRRLAMGILDSLMLHFQNYLKEEHEFLANAQIAYLKKRQKQLGSDFDQALDAHVAYLQDALGVDGFLGLSQEVEMLSEPKELYTAKRHQLDLDAKKWKEERLEASVYHPWKDGFARKHALDCQGASLHPAGVATDLYDGIDLETANKIYTDYSLERDRLSTQMDQLEAVREKVEESDFELGALSSHLVDPVSQKLIETGAEISLRLSDKASWSEKELSHLKQALDKQKLFVHEHLSKQCAILQAKKEVIEDKMGLLQDAALKLIGKEKKILDEKLKEIAEKMGEIPEKWRLESRLKMTKDLIMQVLEGLTQLSESKVIAHHLFHVESKPIDYADAPLQMQNPHLFGFASIGCLLGAFFSSVGVCLIGIFRGFPISKFYLRDQGILFVDMDQNTYQRLALYLAPEETVALIGLSCSQELMKTGCSFIECSQGPQSVEALSLIRKADRFILFLKEETCETLDPYPKEKLLCVLKE